MGGDERALRQRIGGDEGYGAAVVGGIVRRRKSMPRMTASSPSASAQAGNTFMIDDWPVVTPMKWSVGRVAGINSGMGRIFADPVARSTASGRISGIDGDDRAGDVAATLAHQEFNGAPLFLPRRGAATRCAW